MRGGAFSQESLGDGVARGIGIVTAFVEGNTMGCEENGNWHSVEPPKQGPGDLPWRLALLRRYWYLQLWKAPRQQFYAAIVAEGAPRGLDLGIWQSIAGIVLLLICAILFIVFALPISRTMLGSWISDARPGMLTIFPDFDANWSFIAPALTSAILMLIVTLWLLMRFGHYPAFGRKVEQQPSGVWQLFGSWLLFWLLVNTLALAFIYRTGGVYEAPSSVTINTTPTTTTTGQSTALSPTSVPTSSTGRVPESPTQTFLLYDPPAITFDNIMVAITAAFGFATLCTVVTLGRRVYSQRQRHIIYQFEYRFEPAERGAGVERNNGNAVSSNDIEEKELRSTALSLTHLLSINIQRVGRLLSRPQIEALRTQTENPLALILRSGQEEDLVNQLEQFGEIQVSNVSFPFGRLLAFLFANRAETRIRGTVHRNRDGSTEVWMSVFSRRHRQTFDLGRHTFQKTVDDEAISDAELEACAQRYAAKIALELGSNRTVGISPAAFEAFIDGLEASAERNWWYSVAKHRQAIQLAENQRTPFVMGYYQVGVALLLQGEPRLALDQLRMAESQGAQTAELLYMLALTIFTLHFDQIGDVHNPEINAALTYLERAIGLRKHFPEAYHLSGIILYNRGRRIERNESKSETALSRLSPQEATTYRAAELWLRKAYHTYELHLKQLLRQPSMNEQYQRDLADTVRAQLMVAHHWADALRSLHQYKMATMLYEDAQFAFSGKNRNLIDRLLTYCLARQWDEGIEFFEREVRSHGSALWSADVQFYIGWLKAGQAAKELDWRRNIQEVQPQSHPAFPHLNFALLLRPRFAKPRRQTNWQPTWKQNVCISEENGDQLYPTYANAYIFDCSQGTQKPIATVSTLNHVDLMLLLAGYKTKDKTTNANTGSGASEAGASTGASNHNGAGGTAVAISVNAGEEGSITDANADKAAAVTGANAGTAGSINDASAKKANPATGPNAGEVSPSSGTSSDGGADAVALGTLQQIDVTKSFPCNAETYRRLRREAAEQLYKMDKATNLFNRANPGQQYTTNNNSEKEKTPAEALQRLSEESFECWNLQLVEWKSIVIPDKGGQILESVRKLYIKPCTNERHPSYSAIKLGLRSALDLYMQLSMLTCRLLAQAGAFGHLYYVADETYNVLDKWIDLWDKAYREHPNNNTEQRSSPQAYTYSPSVLRYYLVSLSAWRALALLRTEPASKEEKSKNSSLSHYLKQLYDLRSLAGKHGFTQHPLYLYVCAEYYQQCIMFSDASNVLTELLEVTELYDVQRFSPFNFTLDTIKENLTAVELPFEDLGDYEQLRLYERVSGQQQFHYYVNNARIYNKLAEVAAESGNQQAAIGYYFDALTWSPFGDFDLDNFLKLIRSLIQTDRFEQALAAVQQARTRLGSFEVAAEQQGTIATLDVFECIILTRLNQPAASLRHGLTIAQHIEVGKPIEQAQHYQSALPDWNTVIQSFSLLYEGMNEGHKPQLRSSALIHWNNARKYIKTDRLSQNRLVSSEQNTWRDQITSVINAQGEYSNNRRSFIYVFETCELYNNIAYNLALLEIEMDAAISYIATAIHVMLQLHETARKTNHSQTKKRMARLSESLAQYCDTFAWILYRRRRVASSAYNVDMPKLKQSLDELDESFHNNDSAWLAHQAPWPDLHRAIYLLERKSLPYNSHIPTAHYHLSRCYLALAEEIWLDEKDKADANADIQRPLRQYVHKATRHWQITNDLNTSGRLTTDLRRHRKRIEMMRSNVRKPINDVATTKEGHSA
jgi:hypothetical protein